MWRWCCCISSTAQWKCTPELICIIKGIQTYLGPVGLYLIFLSAPDCLCSDRASTALRRYRSFSKGGDCSLRGRGGRIIGLKTFIILIDLEFILLCQKEILKYSEFLYQIVFLAVWRRLSDRIYTFMSGYNRVVWNFTEAKQKTPQKRLHDFWEFSNAGCWLTLIHDLSISNLLVPVSSKSLSPRSEILMTWWFSGTKNTADFQLIQLPLFPVCWRCSSWRLADFLSRDTLTGQGQRYCTRKCLISKACYLTHACAFQQVKRPIGKNLDPIFCFHVKK